MEFTNTRLANEATAQYMGVLLKKEYLSIQTLGEYWRYQEEERILKACNDLGLKDLEEELKNY